MREYRIYYESLEQAECFLRPALEAAIDSRVALVKLSRIGKTSVVAQEMAEALARKDPDFILTRLVDGIESPMLWGEISTAVETEDHLLQRFDSVHAAAVDQIPFIYVHSPRRSRSNHGGQLTFDRSMMFRLAEDIWGLPCFDVEWPTTEDGHRALRNPSAMACPSSLLTLPEIIRSVDDAMADQAPAHVAAFRSDLVWRDTSGGQQPAPRPPSQSSRLFRGANDWVLKFNRWDHAMDPERGMACFWSLALGEELRGRLVDKEATTVSDAAEHFSKATGIRVSANASAGRRYDISDDMQDAVLSRPGQTIVDFCRNFEVLNLDGDLLVDFVWDRSRIPQRRARFGTGSTSAIVQRESIDEDEVTFVVAQQILPLNGFEVAAVSYPGAQGDLPVLEGNGRRVKRTYFDVIGVRGDEIVVVESKGSRSSGAIQRDVEKLRRWKSQEMLSLLRKSLGLSEDGPVYFGAAFPGEAQLPQVDADSLDFQIGVKKDSWSVVLMETKQEQWLTIGEGLTELPVRYQLDS